MSDQVHYELFVRRKPGAQWTLDMATEIRTHALQTAEEALEQGRAIAVRVSKETLDPESREYKSISIFTKGQVDGGKPKKVQEDLDPLCVQPADLYTAHARDRIGRLLEGWLARHNATPFELLHRPDLVEQLEASGTDLQHALQKIAIPEAEARGMSVHELIRTFQGLVERTVANLMKQFKKGALPDLDKEGFARAAERLSTDPDRAFLLGAGVAASIAPGKNWSEKIARLLDLADAAPSDPKARAAALAAIETPLAEIIGSKAGMADLLGAQDKGGDADLGTTLAAMTRLAGGAQVEGLIRVEAGVRTCMPELSGTAKRLGEWLAGDDFPAVRMSIAQRVLKELNGVRRLKPADAEAEIEFLRALAMSLTAAAGRILPPEDITSAFTTRSKTLLNGEFIEALLGRDRSSREEILMLIRLAENVMGAVNKRMAARWLSANVLALRFERELRQGPDSAASKLAALAALQRSLVRSGLVVEDYGPLCARLGEVGGMIEADARLVAMLVRAPAPLPQKLAVLIKLAMGEAGPTGPVADKAKLEAMKLARAPEAREELANSPETMDLLKGMVQQKAAA
ncbi:hypothetical protein ASD89_08005 [Caulobacter sp. Root656]|jgi:hypothetical protein|uniref:Uncharacterized protein n=1 Tax=Caulobacter rhizosphaerae TaxID=2010972 RepID=A0ABU1N2D3_9CAUL|nr:MULTISPECIES: hypothetical protein [Caulobacter]KQZ29205.1 hypothetical protein ASD47_19480 [Caulobacter sp. Root1472]KRA57591.1 hypothetical protein ASD89_08005 [Caulobacter sp. Root656]MDR6532245.1 hypothetical protein [Caulobacter rhizosphaerae]